jgi:type II secretory pathway pseudopilin PulG
LTARPCAGLLPGFAPGRNLPRRVAFTLIELLVVIAVIMILAALAMPTLQRSFWQVDVATCRSNLKQIGKGLAMYGTQFDQYYPPAGRSYRYNISEKTAVGGGKCNIGPLFPDYMGDGRVFYCPAMNGIFTYESPDYGFAKFPDDYCVMAYIYACHAASRECLVRTEQSPRQAIVSDNVIRYMGGDWGCGHYMHVRGYNVLYADNSAEWYPDPDESIAWAKIHSNTPRLFQAWDAFSERKPD